MTSRYPQIDLTALRTMSILDRKSKVSVRDFALPHRSGASFEDFLNCLPDILAGRSLRMLIDRIARAYDLGKPVVVAMGAHVIKCGLSPMLIDLMDRGVITALALNGAGAIHDSEIARFGETSEDVVDGMRTGMFGMAEETAGLLNSAARAARDEQMGFGEALGRAVLASNAPHADASLLASAYRSGVPLTIHACIGCDIVHMHPGAEGAAIGDASMRDFRILTSAMRDLGSGGVLINLGSAVVLPEVILKAITALINLGHEMAGMTGANLDFVQHYRSNQQVVARVREIGGEGISLTGHHEILIPLIAAGVAERLESAKPATGELR